MDFLICSVFIKGRVWLIYIMLDKRQMNKQNLKIAIVAILLSWATNPILMLIHTGITFISEIKFDAPLSAYFIYGYFPLIVAGIYIGCSKTSSRIQIGILVSILYLLKRALFGDLFDADFRHNHLQYRMVILANLTILYAVIVSGSCAITEYIRKKFV